MADIISIKNIEVYAFHGVLESEKKVGQLFYVNATIETDTRVAGMNDDLSKTVNYAKVAKTIYQVMTRASYDLIETCAEKVAEAVLLTYDGIKAIEIEIRKPAAPIPLQFEDVSVKIRREWHKAAIALGANIGEAEKNVTEAFDKLDAIGYTKLAKKSSIIRTAPYGVTDQPDFFNAAAEVETLLSPRELLDELHRIENEAGRVRDERWGPRTLDLDIIFYDDLVLEDDEELCIPHVDMANRDFVLKPLCEIMPYKVHPLTGKRVCEMLADLKKKNGEETSFKFV